MGTGGKGEDEKIQAVLTCQGDIDDPDFPEKCRRLFDTLSEVLQNKELAVTKCEPWNSVKVTFNIPKEAAEKLARLAEQGDQALRELGILSIQVEGGRIISMTMAQDDSDSEDEAAAPPASTTKTGPAAAPAPHLTKVLAKEEKLSAKVEPPDLLHAAKAATATTKGYAASVATFPFHNLLTGQTAVHLKDGPSARPGSVRPVKNSTAAALLSAVGSESSSVLAAGQEGLLASLMSSNSAMMSSSSASFSSSSLASLLNNRDSDGEPVYKKPRKHESFKAATSAVQQQQNFAAFGKAVGSSSGTAQQRLLAGSSGSHSNSSSGSSSSVKEPSSSRLQADALSASSVRLAGLPGVSLTAVVNMPRQQQTATGGRVGGLMPPPAAASASSVTLSPVPRTSLNSDIAKMSSSSSSHPPTLMMPSPETSDRKLFPVQNSSNSNTGKSGSSNNSNNSSNAELSHKLPLVTASATTTTAVNKSTMLINPVTGQFEAGPSGGDSSSEGESDHQHGSGKMSSSSGSNSPDSDPDAEVGLSALDYPGSTKARAAVVSLAGSSSGTSAGGEPSLKLKLKVSKPLSNSSKCVLTGGGPDLLKNSAAPEISSEPKVPKIKIKLKDKIVKLEQTGGGSSRMGGLQSAVATSSSSGQQVNTANAVVQPESASNNHNLCPPVHLDIKTKVKIRPLPVEIGAASLHSLKDNDHHTAHHHPSSLTNNSLVNSGGSNSAGVSGHYRNLTLGHIVLDSAAADRKANRKGGGQAASSSGSAKEKKVKDRLAIWTESLAKHGQREEGSGAAVTNNVGNTAGKVSLPRLFVSASSSSLVGTAFSKSENLTEKGGERSLTGHADVEATSQQPAHLNWAGPGESPSHPGPGPSSRLPCPNSLMASCSSPPSTALSSHEPSKSHVVGSEQPPTDAVGNLKTDSKEAAGGLTSVLDILEGRRPLGDPSSPPGGPGSQDNAGQQGEDSGIESMDTLSEKSPNQGESPFHTTMVEAEGGGSGSSRLPTYSSSMGPAVVCVTLSGKMSPPVSDSGSSDSPPDVSQPATVASLANSVATSSALVRGGCKEICPSPIQPASTTPPPKTFLHESESVLRTDVDASQITGSKKVGGDDSETNICDSVVYQSEHSNSLGKETTRAVLDLDISVVPPALTSAEVGESLVSAAEDGYKSEAATSAEESQLAGADLVRSCDGADKSPLNEPIDILAGSDQSAEYCSADKDVQDYATGQQTVDRNSGTMSRSVSSPLVLPDSNSHTVSSSSGTISCVALADRQPLPCGTVGAATIKSTLLSKRQLSDEVEGGGSICSPPSLVSVGSTVSQGIKLPVSIVTTASTSLAASLSLIASGHPTHTVASLVTNLTSGGVGMGGTLVRAGLPLRPGSKMVPVKLVTVPGAGNVRVLRVSPVRGAEIVTASTTATTVVSGSTLSTTNFLPPRTVVLNSSLIKAISSPAAVTSAPATNCGGSDSVTCTIGATATADTFSLVQYPVPVMAVPATTTTLTTNAADPAAVHFCDKSSVAAEPLTPSPPSSASQLHCPVNRASIVASQASPSGNVGLLSCDQAVMDRLQPVPSPPSPDVGKSKSSTGPSSFSTAIFVEKPLEAATAPSLPSSPRSLSSSPSPGPGNHAADDLLVDAITDGSLDGRDDDRDDVDDDYVASKYMGAGTEQHNGNVSPPLPALMASEDSEASGKRRAPASASSLRSNGEKSDNAGLALVCRGFDEQEDGGSLLRPLLGSSGTDDRLSLTLAADKTTQLQPSSTVVVAAKRSRRDTGSSNQSDRSDMSGGPSGDHATPGKRSRLEETGSKGAGGKPNAVAAVNSKDVGANSKKDGEKKDQQVFKNNKIHDNGTNQVAAKQEDAEVSKKQPATALGETAAMQAAYRATARPSRPAAISKTGAAQDPARRVSTRSKKPDESSGAQTATTPMPSVATTTSSPAAAAAAEKRRRPAVKDTS